MLEARLVEASEYISFHTPGHSGGFVDFAPFNAPIAVWDTTETPLTDDLKNPEGVLAAAETAVGKAYGTSKVLFSTSGATTLIQTAIYKNRKSKFLIYEAAHSSVYNALRLTGAEAYQSTGTELEEGVRRSGADCVVVTSPDYSGRVVPYEKIAALRREGLKIIVDASHGAHFAFSSKLPVSATEYADIVIHSLHKTMPVLTGGAILHVPEESFKEYLNAFRLFHTTSPSYPVMASIEGAAKYFSENGEALYAFVMRAVLEFGREAEKAGRQLLKNDDFSRVVILAPGCGEELYSRLKEAKIIAECCSADSVTLIVTPFNADKLGKVAEVLKKCPDTGGAPMEPIAPPAAITRLEFGEDYEVVPPERAYGRRAFSPIGGYPPGTPAIFPGQRIGERELEYLKKLSLLPGRAFGLDKEGISVIK